MPGTSRSGRRPKPIEQKRRLGETRPSRVPARNKTLAVLAGGDVSAPPALGLSGAAYWSLVQRQSAWISIVDLRLLEEMCLDLDSAADMRSAIAAQGMTISEPIVSPRGELMGSRIVAHPLLGPLRAVMKEIRDLASSLGLDPTARSRLGLAEIKASSKLDELQEKARSRQAS